ncbi:MAG: MBL fold metallo-hydrolase [Chitinophagales bacterium]|nr:MBL fold metallo-hydrolase [Chitinophagales bacterium]MDW8273113.1 MBL fold metallo-hydrolase [Chitinophagales bacterium]
MKLYAINAGYFKLDGGAMFGVVPKTIWQKLNPPDANNLCTWAMRCLLIEDGKKLILIDCGLGNKQSEKFFSYYEPHGDDSIEKNLNKHGFSCNDVTDVILTHLHFDHCGGAIIRNGDKLVPAFPNATYWSNEKHWEWATHPNPREKASFLPENILPIQDSGQLKFTGEDSRDIHPNIYLKTVSGHTESMLIPHIEYRNKTVIYCADLFPSMAHIPVPYVMAYDTRPLLTLEEKQLFLQRGLVENHIFFFEHDNATECCTLKQTERGVREDATFKLEELQ